MEDKMNENLELLQKICENTNDGVIVLGKDFRILFMNPPASRITGYTLEEARRKSCAEMFGSQRCEDACPIRSVKNGKTNSRKVIKFFDKNHQEKFIKTRAIGIQDHWIEIFTDITAEVQIEKQIWGEDTT